MAGGSPTLRPVPTYLHRNTLSAFSGYRWPTDVIMMAVRWYLAYPLSSRQLLELLAERGHRCVASILTWSRVLGPVLAAEVRRRRRVGWRWYVDEVFLFPQPYVHSAVAHVATARRSVPHWT